MIGMNRIWFNKFTFPGGLFEAKKIIIYCYYKYISPLQPNSRPEPLSEVLFIRFTRTTIKFT